jgi:hypothetical protein
MRDRRDQRDPQKLGEAYLAHRKAGHPPGYAALLAQEGCPDYDGSGPMANDPAEHHSKTPQTVDLQEPSDGPLGDS